jgi:hypothetical protein
LNGVRGDHGGRSGTRIYRGQGPPPPVLMLPEEASERHC